MSILNLLLVVSLTVLSYRVQGIHATVQGSNSTKNFQPQSVFAPQTSQLTSSAKIDVTTRIEITEAAVIPLTPRPSVTKQQYLTSAPMTVAKATPQLTSTYYSLLTINTTTQDVAHGSYILPSSSVIIAGTQASSKDCINQTPDLGMAKGTIADADITASTILNSDSRPKFARLNNSKGWIADKDKHPWMQVNLHTAINITAIATQGVVYRDKQHFIKSYYLSYGDDGNNWVNYTIQGMTKVFQANVDANSIVKVVFNSSVFGKFIRIHPTDCSIRCALRMELYGCNSTGGIPGRPSPPIATSILATSINITWSAPDYVGDGITGYNVRWEDVGASTPSQKVIVGNKSRVATLSNISPYTNYTIEVQAFNGKGDSPWSFPLIVQSSESVPSVAPGNLTLSSSSSLTLDILWDAIPQKKQHGKLLGYKIFYRKEGSDTEKTVNVGPDILMLKITELKFANYSVRVAGFTGVGVGKFTDALKRFPREGAASPPRNLQLRVVSSTSIEASWDEPETRNGHIRRYVVSYGKKGIDSHFYTTETKYRLISLDENTLYSVQVTAETSVSGNPSGTKQATTLEDGEILINMAWQMQAF
ncbi:cell adhesion molecule DSCAML1-like [Montipora capricornis]|uniref:cell adhesion molecule DSCAML1-like n=1 Tax=Montipora capricornis TaxID=246305 RepID=UPI0035F16F30